MNQTAAATGNAAASMVADTTGLLTSVHLAWLVVLALLVIAGIAYGSRLKHRREAAERHVAEHAEQAGVAPPDAAPPAPAPAPAIAPAREAEAEAGAEASGAGGAGGAADGAVSQLKGLGPRVAARLAELGITTVGQVAALDHDAAQALDAQLGPFRGRMERDRWVEQARFLAAGDVAGFEAVFGKL